MRAALHDANGEVVNVIVYDPDVEFTPDPGLTLVELVDEPVGPGWTYDGTGFNPPPVKRLETDRTSVPADSTTTAVVTYQNTFPDAPATVDFDVNGQTATEALADGIAQIQVVASVPGPVTVAADGLEVTIDGTAV